MIAGPYSDVGNGNGGTEIANLRYRSKISICTIFSVFFWFFGFVYSSGHISNLTPFIKHVFVPRNKFQNHRHEIFSLTVRYKFWWSGSSDHRFEQTLKRKNNKHSQVSIGSTSWSPRRFTSRRAAKKNNVILLLYVTRVFADTRNTNI